MRVMAIGAHSDDAELACGGTLAKAVANGHEVELLVLTESDYVSLDNRVLRTKDEAWTEALDAAKVLGIEERHVRFLPFVTRELPYNATAIAETEKVINAFRPDVVLSHWPFDTHQDHRNAGLTTISAGRYYNSILMYEPMMPSGRSYVAFRPQVYVDVSDFIEQKLEALRRHASQYAKYGDDWIAAIESRCRLRGFEIGCKYAEAFEAARFEWKLSG
jgi:LmbE family N-acetylglucosaminyl deacetylase